MFVTAARYRLNTAVAVLARYVVKAWNPDAHPRDPRTGRFIRNPTSATAGRPGRRRRTITNHSASATTRKAIARAQKTLPADRDGWRSHVAKIRPAQRRIDRRLDDFRRELADAKKKLAAAEAALQDEFRRKRTPKHRREDIAKERLRSERAEVVIAQNTVDHAVELANDPNLADKPGGATWLEIVEAEETPDYPKDPAGNPMPPEAYHKALDAVLDVGRQLYDDYTDSVQRDRQYLDRQQQLAEGEFATAKILEAVKAGDSEERQRLTAGRAQLFREQKRREQELLLDLLKSVRPVGGARHVNASAATEEERKGLPGNAVEARKDWRERLRIADEVFPDDWVRMSSEKPLYVGSHPQRAFHSHSVDGSKSLLAMSGTSNDGYSYTGAFKDYTDEVTVHEMGHRMEMIVPGLKELEFTFVRRRSTDEDGRLETARKLSELQRGTAYESWEVAFPDKWRDAYAGKTYEHFGRGGDPAKNYWEVFQVGLQDTLGRGHHLHGDEELQHFTLGVLATLARSDGRQEGGNR